MINVLADQYLFNIQSFVPPHINLTLYDPAKGLPSLTQAHALLIRTVNPINKQTLPTIPETLEFIGTGSAGTDHVDIPYLQEQGVTFCSAAGCNARSVAEYIATVLLVWGEERQKDLQECSVGVVGAGQVGSQVDRLVKELGMQSVTYDPPRERRDPSFSSASLDEVLSCDILTLHTPLNHEGKYATYHWLNSGKLGRRNYSLIINASRGGVADERALLEAQQEGLVEDFVLDVWEKEPAITSRVARRAYIKTPHIAGYSVQAKNNASRLIASALVDYFQLSLPEVSGLEGTRAFSKKSSEFSRIDSLLQELHPIKEYDSSLQEILDHYPQDKEKRFNKLRAEFPLRQEFSHICLAPSFFSKFPVLDSLGFSVNR